MHDDDARAKLTQALPHTFERPELLRDAVTHKSYANEHARTAPSDNERLEFLGDAVVGAVAAVLLFEHFPQASEGELTRRRADLVCEASLASIANDLGVADALRLGKGEEKSGGRAKPRLLASAFEAVVGAVYLDSGMAATTKILGHVFAPRLDVQAPGERDYKSRIQELIQARGQAAPRYRLVGTSGPDHDREFVVAIDVEDEPLAEGTGRSKLDAEQGAARRALEVVAAEAKRSEAKGEDSP